MEQVEKNRALNKLIIIMMKLILFIKKMILLVLGVSHNKNFMQQNNKKRKYKQIKFHN